jgi:osmotically-inducible protein OsmY
MVQSVTLNKEDIKRNLIEQLLRDNRVDATNIAVALDDDGMATLTGTVPTSSDQHFAGLDVLLTPGVVKVVNRLTVHYPDTLRGATDVEIQANIRDIFFWNTGIDARNIEVLVQNGIVNLEGSVPDYWQKMKAEDLVQGLEGVGAVSNRLTVVPTQTVSDEEIAGSIVEALGRTLRIDLNGVNVSVMNGMVTLNGSVPDTTVYHKAADIAAFTKGVKAVNNNLMIA